MFISKILIFVFLATVYCDDETNLDTTSTTERSRLRIPPPANFQRQSREQSASAEPRLSESHLDVTFQPPQQPRQNTLGLKPIAQDSSSGALNVYPRLSVPTRPDLSRVPIHEQRPGMPGYQYPHLKHNQSLTPNDLPKDESKAELLHAKIDTQAPTVESSTAQQSYSQPKTSSFSWTDGTGPIWFICGALFSMVLMGIGSICKRCYLRRSSGRLQQRQNSNFHVQIRNDSSQCDIKLECPQLPTIKDLPKEAYPNTIEIRAKQEVLRLQVVEEEVTNEDAVESATTTE